MKKGHLRNVLISVFVVFWTAVFHYESVRFFYLNPLVDGPLPKVKFLFPPAGWIMFYRVDDKFSHAEVYGVKNGQAQLIDPHDIIPTRFVGFDNIKRGILGRALPPRSRESFCRYMKRKIPYFDQFVVTAVYYPNITESPHERFQEVVYQCSE